MRSPESSRRSESTRIRPPRRRLIDWASYHSPVIARFTTPPAVVLVRHGRIVRRNLQREHVSEEELAGMLRQHGIERLREVKIALMESDGEISVIPYGKATDDGPPRRRPT